ncbi:MAG: glutaredoxin family protein [Methylophilaceae bacterium]|jgi:hypothetical protein|nr:glutaredoxin family protein [Methylophilaceae bacterium]MDG1454301.1 glutaredoxin family protein [Methylophilaceae bacterium]
MPTLIQLNFYTTSNCHLCEQAEELLSTLENIELNYIEIVDSDALINAYGTRIPVLQRTNNNADELDWPFNLQQILTFIHT